MQFEAVAVGGRAGIDKGDYTQRWRTSCGAGRRSSKICTKGRICNHLGNVCAGCDQGWVGRGGMVRTLKNELAFNCQMQIPSELETIAWITGHASTLLNLDVVGSDGKVPFERWRGRGHHMTDACFWNECSIEWVH